MIFWHERADIRTMKKTTAESNTDIKIAVIFVGMQGTGKTGFYERYFSDAYTHISLSELGSRQSERQVTSDCIYHGVSYVIDSQNLTREDRRRYFLRAKEAGYRIIGYYFPSTVEESLLRAGLSRDKNARRRQKKAIERLEPPVYDEGFDEIYNVTIDRSGEYIAERLSADCQ